MLWLRHGRVQLLSTLCIRCSRRWHQVQQALADTDADVEHSLLGGTPEAAVKLQELEVQIAQKAARNAQAEKERQERISTEFAALKAADTAESSTKPTRQDFDHIAFENADMEERH